LPSSLPPHSQYVFGNPSRSPRRFCRFRNPECWIRVAHTSTGNWKTEQTLGVNYFGLYKEKFYHNIDICINEITYDDKIGMQPV
jgi:hypothetical protein